MSAPSIHRAYERRQMTARRIYEAGIQYPAAQLEEWLVEALGERDRATVLRLVRLLRGARWQKHCRWLEFTEQRVAAIHSSEKAA